MRRTRRGGGGYDAVFCTCGWEREQRDRGTNDIAAGRRHADRNPGHVVFVRQVWTYTAERP